MTSMQENIRWNTPARFMWQVVRDHPGKTGGMVLGDFIQAVCLMLLPFVTRDLVNVVVAFEPAQSHVSIWEAAFYPFRNFMLVNLVLLISARASGAFLMFLAPVLRILPRKRMTEQLQNHALDFFQSGHSGALGTKINTATVSLGHCMWVLVFDLWPVILKFIVSAILMFFANFIMGIAIALWSLVYFTVRVYLAYKLYRFSRVISDERAALTGSIVDMATNIQAVKSFANEKYENDKLDDEMIGEITGIRHFNIYREIGGWFHSIMTLLAMGGLMGLSLHYYAQGLITVGDIAFVFSLILILTEQSASLAWSVNNFLELYGQLSDGVRTIFQPVSLKDREGARELHVEQGRLVFRDVHFQYEDDLGKHVFSGMNLDIPPGQKIGLIGPSGAGKTTLINLLLRFHDIQEGNIEIDGQDISNVSQQSLRRNISVIPQDTSLFHRSLMDNIRYGNLDASDEEVIEASKKAFAHEFISALPQGYDTYVGERGVKLSGGQRQRIAIARAILKDAKILILDEATSALDSESERYIQQSLQELMADKTVIAIAHRLSTIAHLDRLIVMDDGVICEDGTHDELLSRNGLYARLWQMQSGGFLGV